MHAEIYMNRYGTLTVEVKGIPTALGQLTDSGDEMAAIRLGQVVELPEGFDNRMEASLSYALSAPPLTEAQKAAAIIAAMAEHSKHVGSYPNDWRIPIALTVLAALEAIWGLENDIDKAPLSP